ncbi:YbaB/EbfC family nucleoid-associated protein [Lentzea sp. NPDC003310]|uniref:YbaB/EbfC family nucleoid-associated protein n=1 Tax=Lentzea sp. NPDC003310 TaxID=3154447 RepID=UPI0033B82909
MKTPEEWMRDFEAKIAEAQAKAAAVQEGLAQAGGSASSKDGSIVVSVAPNGALTGLELTADAMRKAPGQLSGEILEIARKAQRGAAVKVAETFGAVEGTGSETYRLITEYLPPPVEEEQPKPAGYAFNEEYEERAATAPQPPPLPARRPAPRPDDDEDFGGDSIFKKH